MNIQVCYDRKQKVFHVNNDGDFSTFATPASLAMWAWNVYKIDFDPLEGYEWPRMTRDKVRMADELQECLRTLA